MFHPEVVELDIASRSPTLWFAHIASTSLIERRDALTCVCVACWTTLITKLFNQMNISDFLLP